MTKLSRYGGLSVIPKLTTSRAALRFYFHKMQPAVDIFSNKIELIAPDPFIPSNSLSSVILQRLSNEIPPKRIELSRGQFFKAPCHNPQSPWFLIELCLDGSETLLHSEYDKGLPIDVRRALTVDNFSAVDNCQQLAITSDDNRR